MTGEAFVRVFQPLNVVELALAKAVLEEHGAPGYIENEHYFTTGGGFLSHGDTEVWVRVRRTEAEVIREALEDRIRRER